MNRIALCLIGFVSIVSAHAEAASMDVLVANPKGRAAYKGTRTAAAFSARRELAPGHYVVQFKARDFDPRDYAIVVGAGKRKVVAIGVDEERAPSHDGRQRADFVAAEEARELLRMRATRADNQIPDWA
ncbi:MAG: hypothetical protein M3032_04650 [Verrucomicrobiota bacterium]|nr:hypothetical protein [Verrucomicrobiota bacterium]